jgi:hypothetical protein
MTGHERGKGGFGMLRHVFPQQSQVVVRHFNDISPPP